MRIKTTVLQGQDTLLASWSALAQVSPGARVIPSAVTAAAVFPAWTPLNNAILLNAHDGTAAASQLTSVYADAGADVWALWMPSRVTEPERARRQTRRSAVKQQHHNTRHADGPATGLRFHDGVVRTCRSPRPVGASL